MEKINKTLSLQNSVTFGTKAEADESAHRINKLHEVINGKDEVSGGYYDALDHGNYFGFMLVCNFFNLFYEKTVKKLGDEQKDQYHLENMKSMSLF